MTSKSKQEWRDTTLKKVVEKRPERKGRFMTTSGLEVEPLYTAEDMGVEDPQYLEKLGYPGEYPYTRGIMPNMYRGRVFTIRQYAGFADAEATNKRYRYLLDAGQTGLSMAFHLPTQIGYDSDHPMAAGEVGKVGVAIDTLRDLETVFEGIPMDKISTSMTINSTAPILMAMYITVAKNQGVDPKVLDGTIQNDMLKEYVSRGTQIFPPRPSIRLATDIVEYCRDNVPRWNPISMSGYHIREAGSTAAQEIAFTLANSIAMIQACLERGLDIDLIGPRWSFFHSSHTNFLEEVAKFRAMRRLWAKIMRERYGAKDPRSWQFRFHVQTAGVTLTGQQPLNNLVRTGFQALSAVLGGVNSLHTNSYDEAYWTPTEGAVTAAVRTQQMIAYEIGVGDTVDPLGGSYYIEKLTDDLEEKAAEYIRKIDDLGGSVAAIEQGYIQREIQDASYQYVMGIEKKDIGWIGVNMFESPFPPLTEMLRIGPEVGQKQIERLNQVRRERDNAKVQASLKRLEEAMRGTENTMPAFLECVEAYATIGEMADTGRRVFGEQKEFLFI